jgi:putative transcriptional regulator
VTRTRGAAPNPTPAEVRAAREAAGLTQAQAAALVSTTLRAWQAWEQDGGEYARRMHAGLWELFKIKTCAGWTPCTARMPEQGVDVLVVVDAKENADEPPFVTISRWSGNAWWSDEGWCVYHSATIRHWMPLPGVPQD